jgi:predicted TIM-barrel enzyme
VCQRNKDSIEEGSSIEMKIAMIRTAQSHNLMSIPMSVINNSATETPAASVKVASLDQHMGLEWAPEVIERQQRTLLVHTQI